MSVQERLSYWWEIRAEDKSVWQRFRRNLSISLLGSTVSLAIKLGQTALLTRLLRIDDYGRVLIVLNLFVFLESFAGLRTSDVMFRFFQPFREQQDRRALQGLLLLCLAISLLTGLLIFGSVRLFSGWLAVRVYQNPELASLFNLYGGTILLTTLSGVYEPVLRIYNRFAAVVVPQVLGSLTTLAILVVHFATADNVSLKTVVAAFAVGVVVQTLPPLAQAIQLLKPSLAGVKVKRAAQALAKYRGELMRCLFHSNLSGYLKFAISPGDIFLLGLFSTPAQVALYGLARQLAAPLALLQTNVQIAITPEVALLTARRKFEQLKRLVNRYLLSAFLLSGLVMMLALVPGRLLILWMSRAEYVAALPVFYILLAVAWLMLVFLVFRPLALSLDLLRWFNLGQLASTALLFLFIFKGGLTAMTMAYIQLAGALIVRLLFNIPVWTRLRALAFSSERENVTSAN
jgi:O-antigen/teichoic acid export membrane protein